MRKKIDLKKILRKKKLSVGTWLTINSSKILDILISMEFDWIAIDLEHSSISISEAQELIRIIDLGNKVPIVRLSSNDAIQAKRVLDAGAKGIIVPMINSIDDAKKAAEYTFFPPNGIRSVGLSRSNMYGENFKQYHQNSKDIVLVLQIEHVDAVKNLDQIISLSQVDSIMVGPYDLSGSMGISGQFENPKFKKILREIENKVSKRGISLGIHMISPNIEELKRNIKKNYNFIAYSLDTVIIIDALKDISNFIKKIKK